MKWLEKTCEILQRDYGVVDSVRAAFPVGLRFLQSPPDAG
jgi:hypothetical protein